MGKHTNRRIPDKLLQLQYGNVDLSALPYRCERNIDGWQTLILLGFHDNSSILSQFKNQFLRWRFVIPRWIIQNWITIFFSGGMRKMAAWYLFHFHSKRFTLIQFSWLSMIILRARHWKSYILSGQQGFTLCWKHAYKHVCRRYRWRTPFREHVKENWHYFNAFRYFLDSDIEKRSFKLCFETIGPPSLRDGKYLWFFLLQDVLFLRKKFWCHLNLQLFKFRFGFLLVLDIFTSKQLYPTKRVISYFRFQSEWGEHKRPTFDRFRWTRFEKFRLLSDKNLDFS